MTQCTPHRLPWLPPFVWPTRGVGEAHLITQAETPLTLRILAAPDTARACLSCKRCVSTYYAVRYHHNISGLQNDELYPEASCGSSVFVQVEAKYSYRRSEVMTWG